MTVNPTPIPPGLVDHFALMSERFVAAVHDAVEEAAAKPEFAGTPAFRAWLEKALPLLQEQNAAIQQAAKRFALGEVGAILALAEDKRGLGKDLEGFPLTFAGPDKAGLLEELETAVVSAAYQLCAAAQIP